MPIALIFFLVFVAPPAVAQASDPLELDPSFAGDGTLTIQIALHDYAAKGFFEPTGEIVIVGDSVGGNASNRAGILLRLGADGSQGPIASFPAAAFGCSTPRAFRSGIRLSGGDYLGGGFVQAGCGGVPRHFNVLKLDPSGSLLDEFDTVVFNNQLAYVFGLAEQADGKIVAAGLVSGSGFVATTYDIGVARFLADGSLDASFGTNGIFTYDSDNDQDYAQDVIVDPQGRILVAGRVANAMTGLDWAVLRLTEDGALDTSFGNGGVFTHDHAGLDETATALARHGSGRILVSGYLQEADGVTHRFAVLGLDDAGALDTGFSGDGVTIVDFGVQVAVASAITVGPTGRVFVAGSAEIGGTGPAARDAAVAVLLQDGRMDPSYNGGAGKTFEFGGQPVDLPADIAVNALGTQILVTGYTESTDRTTQQFAVARLIGLDPAIFSDSYEAAPD